MKQNIYPFIIITTLFLFAYTANAQTPIITTIAGSNIRTFYEGANDTVGQLFFPSGVALDYKGNMYICDAYNYAIRKVNLSSGAMTLYAGNGDDGYSGDGGPATAATISLRGYFLTPHLGGVFHFEGGLAIDGIGNVYIADVSNRVVRKVDTFGIITTFAGTGSIGPNGDGGPATAASLNAPSALTTDIFGNVYISDEGYSVVRKVDALGIISTVAGNDTSGYSGDGGYATAAKLGQPLGICMDDSNNLYIADFYYSVVRKVSYTGIISTFAGTGTFGYSGDVGPATASSLNQPVALASDKNNNIYISDYYNNRVRKVSNSRIISTIANGTGYYYCGDGGPATATCIGYPYGITLDTVGNLYLCDFGNNRIRAVNTDGIISTIAGNSGYSGDGGQASNALISSTSGVVTDFAGNIYFADKLANVVRKINPSGIISTVAGNGIIGYNGDGILAVNARLNYPSSVAVDKSGNLYIADYQNNRIRKVDNTTGLISTFAGNGSTFGTRFGNAATATGIPDPIYIAIDSSGNLYISEGSIIIKVDATSATTTLFAGSGTTFGDGGPATKAQLQFAYDMVFDSLQNLYIADWLDNAVRIVNAQTGIISTVAGNRDSCYSGAAFINGGVATNQPICDPYGLAINDSGNLFISNSSQIFQVSITSGNAYYIGGNKSNWGKTGYEGPADSAYLYYPEGLAVNSQGNLIIADFNNRVLRMINIGTYAGIPKIAIAKPAIRLYPNPNSGVFTIESTVSPAENGTPLSATVCNIFGQEVFSTTAKVINNYITIDITIPPTLPAGIYYCSVSGNNTNAVLKFEMVR